MAMLNSRINNEPIILNQQTKKYYSRVVDAGLSGAAAAGSPEKMSTMDAAVAQRLSAPDGILEEATLEADLRDFVAAGGQPLVHFFFCFFVFGLVVFWL
jgi:hypothetical protein